jgi:hypothetical protein
MINFIRTFAMIIISFSCSLPRFGSNFDEFSSKFKEITLPFQINDSLAFKNWNSAELIDNNYVKEYKLLTQHADKVYPLKLQDYKCSYIGKYKVKDYVVLLYKTFTTEAGRGNPVIILATYTVSGEKKDETTALWDDAEDPLYSQRVTLDISKANTFSVKSLIKYNGYLNGRIVPKKVIERTLYYEINTEGLIEKKVTAEKDLFIDDNPDILDDFPSD